MHPEIQKKIGELSDALARHAPYQAVSFKLFVNSQEVTVEMAMRTPAQLESEGVSMRNLAGQFIQEGQCLGSLTK